MVITSRSRRVALVLMGSLAAACSPGAADETGSAEAAVEVLPERVAGVVRKLDLALHRCPERVWPGIAGTYRTQAQVLLVGQAAGRAYLWNDRAATADGAPPVTTSVSTEGLAARWFASFAPGTYGGVPTLGISLDWTQRMNDRAIAAGVTPWHDSAATLTFHEAFHFLSGQSSWPLTAGATRYAPHPVRWEPRYFQRMMKGALLEVANGTPGADLAATAYWRHRMHREWPGEVARTRTTDTHEGSAEYAEIVSSAIAERGCDASDAELLATIRARLGSLIRLESFDADSDAYELGVLAGLVAHERGTSGWHESVASGATPVDALVASTSPVAQPDRPDIATAVEQQIAERNADVDRQVAPMLERLTSPEVYRIAVPDRWRAGSFSVQGFYQLVDQPGSPEVRLAYGATYESPEHHRIVVSNLTVTSPATTPCSQEKSVVLTVPAAAVAIAGDLFTATSKEVRLADLPATVVTHDGLPWICPAGVGAPVTTEEPAIERVPGGFIGSDRR